jgi:hypothetical protein
MVDLKRFKVIYRGVDGAVREGVVQAYDVETARSRAVHECMVETLDLIVSITPLEP